MTGTEEKLTVKLERWFHARFLNIKHKGFFREKILFEFAELAKCWRDPG